MHRANGKTNYMSIDDQPYRSISIKTAKNSLLSKGFELSYKFFICETDTISIVINGDFIHDFINNTPTPGFKKNVQNKTYVSPDEFDEFLKCNMSKDEYKQKVISYQKKMLTVRKLT